LEGFPEGIREGQDVAGVGEEETFRDDHREAFPEGRWLTYDEIAKIRGIGRASAVKLAQRERWQRRPGNDRTARVLVPVDWLKPARRSGDTSPEEFPESSRELSRIIGVLEAAIAASKEGAATDAAAISTLREQLAEANRRAHSDAAAIAEANARSDRAEQGREGERARADALRDRLNVMQAQLADAHAALQRAETADARAERAEQDKERAEHGRDAERVRADALRERLDDLTGKLSDAQAELAAVQDQADAASARAVAAVEAEQAVRQAEAEAVAGLHRELENAQKARAEAESHAAELRQAETERRARGLLARLRAALRSE
jgi:chromosome segregation ATPase